MKYDLPLLDYKTRFSLWQVKMRVVLAQTSDLDEALESFGKKKTTEWTAEEKRKDHKALSLIQLHLSNDILQEVLQEKTAAELWLKLESICVSKDLTSKMHIKMKLFLHKLQESGSVLNHISVFKEIVVELVSMEVQFDDEDLGLLLLCSLPSSYANFRDTILLSRDELTLAEVYEALQNREKMKGMVQSDASSSKGEALQVRGRSEQRTYNDSNDRDKSQSRGCSKSRGKKFCKYCKKKNHFIEECWKLQNKEKRKSDDVVRMGDDNPREIVGISSVQIKTHDGMTRTLKDVRHIPGMARNLISLSTLDAEGYKYSGSGGVVKVSKGSLVYMIGDMNSTNLYVLRGSTLHGSITAAAVSKDEPSKTNLWHMRLGHMSELGMAELMKRNLLDGCTQGNMKFCEHCVFGKHKRVKFNTSVHRSKGILDYVHADLWGPSRKPSLGGACYMLTIIDDYSRKVWPYFLKHKDDTFAAFKEWKVMIERQTEKEVKVLRTDSGGEFCSDAFDDYCRKEGIVRHHTIPYTPQQNGVAERMNRTIISNTRCMLSNARMNKRFWAEVANTACYLINRSPSIPLNKKTPIEVWSGMPADYSQLRVFGCTAYAHVDNGKLEPRAIKCLFLGYGSGVKGYKLWNPKTNKTFMSRSVVFNESVMFNDSLPTDVILGGSDEEQQYVSVQVEHVDDQETEIVGNDVNVTVQHSPPVLQPQDEPIAHRRTKRSCGAPIRFIEECDMVYYAFSCAEQVENTLEPATYTEAVVSGDREKWISAMQEEMQSLEKNGTWELVHLPKQKKPVHCKWIFKRKEGLSPSEPPRFKASIDVKTAFLHGELEEEIYMDQPEGFIVPGKEDYVCKLKRSLYGLKQSPRQWYKRFDSFMLSHGFKRSEFDSCVYIKFVNGSPIYLLLYVDDMLIAAKSKEQITALKKQLSSEFDMKDLGVAKKILALQCASTDEDVEYMSRVPYSSAVGSLMYAMVCSRPDLSHAMSLVSRYMANPGKEHWKAVQWIFRYLKGIADACLKFGRTDKGLVGYVDSDFAADLDKRRSLTGYVFTIGSCAMSWKATLQPVVAQSTTEAEYMAIAEACKESVWLKGLFAELCGVDSCINLFCDSQSAICLTKDQMFHERTKHIDIKYHYVRDVVAQSKLKDEGLIHATRRNLSQGGVC
uniref:Retrotransposon protein, putative, Ty1-copia subclass n=1 Tax=Oryza sativa subsp. japonica TaxID=39947 RepID=Q2QYR7_ORYSJ|nr:retrotransposon protein, putative, Ty1-copia subclass [Oryza sativa Japonica Group]